MIRFLRVMCILALGTGFGLAAAGCGESPKGDKMGAGNMSSSKMNDGHMGNKMDDGKMDSKMGDHKMADEKMKGKMADDKMTDDKK
jgi:hypothetical protein